MNSMKLSHVQISIDRRKLEIMEVEQYDKDKDGKKRKEIQ